LLVPSPSSAEQIADPILTAVEEPKNDSAISFVRKIKQEVTNTSQRALGLDGIRFDLQVALERLERISEIESTLSELK